MGICEVKHSEFSDLANTDTPEYGGHGCRYPTNDRPVLRVNKEGLACGRLPNDQSPSWQLITNEERETKGYRSECYGWGKQVPIDPNDIVWPDGWLCDADGRGLSWLEMQRMAPQQRKAA